jgi:hypothetical protein
MYLIDSLIPHAHAVAIDGIIQPDGKSRRPGWMIDRKVLKDDIPIFERTEPDVQTIALPQNPAICIKQVREDSQPWSDRRAGLPVSDQVNWAAGAGGQIIP